MSNLISRTELVEITGASQPKRMCDVLRKNGIRFVERVDGYPSLSWEAYNAQLSGKSPKVSIRCSNDDGFHLERA